MKIRECKRIYYDKITSHDINLSEWCIIIFKIELPLKYIFDRSKL
jgi:hypothetical protein